ncbi:MAG: transglutaminase domain-containing protein [Spirochaetota bacterium]
MRNKIKNIFIIFMCAMLPVALAVSARAASDASFNTVPLAKYSDKVYSESASRFRILSGDSEFLFPETSTQKIISKGRTNNIYSFLVLTGKYDEAAKQKPGPAADYLSGTILLNTDDPEITRLKYLFKNSGKIIEDVENYVYKFISNKIFGIPIISASEILRNKSGDCTEHTVLAVTILRSLGVPARALVGMLLSKEFDGSRNVFVYHMWAEAFVNGRWVLVDAANPGTKYPNRYIALAYHHLKTEMPLSYLKAVSAMKSFSIEYAE